MNTENNELSRIKKAAKSILQVDPCDITKSQYRRWIQSASDTAEWVESFIASEDDLDEDTLYDLSVLLADLQEVSRG